jgi:hypothetical protein
MIVSGNRNRCIEMEAEAESVRAESIICLNSEERL